jgi:hypothetical protein
MTMMMQPRGHMWLEAPAYRTPGTPHTSGRSGTFIRTLTGARIARESALVIFAYFAYFLVRGFTRAIGRRRSRTPTKS